jgi:hypothetical protein
METLLSFFVSWNGFVVDMAFFLELFVDIAFEWDGRISQTLILCMRLVGDA